MDRGGLSWWFCQEGVCVCGALEGQGAARRCSLAWPVVGGRAGRQGGGRGMSVPLEVVVLYIYIYITVQTLTLRPDMGIKK